MTTNRDRQLDENLRALGSAGAVPGVPSAALKARCLNTLGGSASRAVRPSVFRKRAWWSSVGLAAMFGLAAIPFFNGPVSKVKAAVVLTKLTEQIEGSDIFQVTIDEITVADEVWVNGLLQLSDTGIAGDVHARVLEALNGKSIEVDLSLGISPEGGWVLIRSLKIPDPQIQPFLELLFPAGTETLLILPDEVVAEVAKEALGGEFAEVRAMATGHVVSFIKSALESKEDLGITIQKQRDGTMLLSLPVTDDTPFKSLIAFAAKQMGQDADQPDLGDIDGSDFADLIGATFTVVYDPQAEAVRSFSVSNVADMKGTVSVALHGGEIDADLLDSNRVKGPNTRVLDISALKSLVEGLEHTFDH